CENVSARSGRRRASLHPVAKQCRQGRPHDGRHRWNQSELNQMKGKNMRRTITAVATLIAGVTLGAQAPQPLALPKVAPTIDQILSLERADSPEISPDGQRVAYTVRRTNWDDNAYDTQIWLGDVRDGRTRQLSSSKKSSSSPAWSPDGSRLAFLSDRTEKRQIYVINPLGGEADALTTVEDGVTSFEWSPDGTRIAFAATEPKTSALKDREKKYGEFQVIDEEHRMTHLSLVDVRT